MQRHLGKVKKRPKDHFKMSCQESDGFRCFPTLADGTRFVNPPNDACNSRTGTVGPYVARKGVKIRLERPRMVETIRTKDSCLNKGRRNHSRVIFGIFSL